MTTVAVPVRAGAHAYPSATPTPVRLALLGVGQVGGALAALVARPPLSHQFHVESGLVRDLARERPGAEHLQLTANLRHALGGQPQPQIVIEALGGIEPALTLVLTALERGIPVVTANKSLLAAHGDVLIDAAGRAGVPLRYEAAVLAGVPFLGTFARRALARDITGFCGIVNGTTNFMLSRMAAGRTGFAEALAEAQRKGYAEPDPANDVNGVDAVEKLAVLLRHFGDWSVRTQDVDAQGIAAIEGDDLAAAVEFGGTLKSIVAADWREGSLSAFSGPSFLSDSHPLARVNGVQNAVSLRNRLSGDLFFAGAGAGPDVTAATLLDDAAEMCGETPRAEAPRTWKRATPSAPATGWFVRVSGDRLPADTSIADLCSAYGVWLRRTSEPRGDAPGRRWFLTHPCAPSQIADALRALESAAGCDTFRARILEA
jgi:homoserine dehydrogenase